MNDTKVGIGILGLGKRGVHFGGDYFGQHPDCELVGICDMSPEKITATQEILGDIPATTSIDEFLSFSGLDAVVICTPDHAHAETALAVLGAGKHVYLEKPMAQSIDDCDRMIEAAEKAGVVFMIGLELRYCTLFQDMKKLIDAGAIGEIKTGQVIDNVSVGGDYYFHNARRKKSYIKSLMLEKGTHSLDLVNWMVDSSPKKVYASGGLDVLGGDWANDKRCRDCEMADTCPYYVDYEQGLKLDYGKIKLQDDLCVYSEECDVDDNSLTIIDYINGARISYTECMFTPEYTREFTFVGTKGKMYGFYNNEQDFKIIVQKRHTREKEIYYPERVEGSHGGGDKRIVDQFIKYVQKGKPELPGIWGARDSAAIAIAATESIESGVPVFIPEKTMPIVYER